MINAHNIMHHLKHYKPALPCVKINAIEEPKPIT